MKKKELFKKLLNDRKHSAELLIAVNVHDFNKKPLKYIYEGITFELIQVGNDIKIKE
jgi:hypothetical protein